ncbi:hypothetical protein BN1080_01395 [Planococcus massiliensis]|uniref:Smf/DprA SLOG domain-containing protein n=1 Tax=Planococcus massiliensis TaxID=1499687 RepID=A0A098EME1_9BACL|nr:MULTISPECIES: DNA-processing protein DprA [Planococcus]MCJ1907232.1 DNA-processing protein DprA [Planococcus ruber]CEG22466.1 hypothetical protein BN1080_01395 [Planococcus massiliensis]
MTEEFLQRFYALHYVYPKPLNRLQRLMADDPELGRLTYRPPNEWSALLGISIAQAASLKKAYADSLHIPFDELYQKHKITPISYFHSHYPESLLDLIDPPAILYAKGDTRLLLAPFKIAIIGSRKATGYSRAAIQTLLPPLIAKKTVIVSGLAVGADAMAHQEAIDSGGRTIAVTGSGFLHPYPKENRPLNNIIEETHLVITEYPPYMQPLRWNFPMRNRIISGLSKGIIVTEAKEKSGTMSTIEHALEHGRDVFAVPGNIYSPLSAGPHKLIAEGAVPLWNGGRVLEEYPQLTEDL